MKEDTLLIASRLLSDATVIYGTANVHFIHPGLVDYLRRKDVAELLDGREQLRYLKVAMSIHTWQDQNPTERAYDPRNAENIGQSF